MPDLIPFLHRQVGQDTIPTVNGRDIHAFLELSRDYSDWVKRQIKRAQLVENRDYIVSYTEVENPKGGRPATEYHFTFDAAKHIGMLSGTDKGHEVREYFIAKEKELYALQIEEERHPLVRQAKAIARLEARTQALEDDVKALKERRPPEGKLTRQAWLRQHHKPKLPTDLFKAFGARCKALEEPERFRPEGYEYPQDYYSSYTLAQAYADVTKQLSFIREARAPYHQRREP